MITIHKYVLEIEDETQMAMPWGFELLTAQMQHGKLCIWAKVDDKKKAVMVQFRVVGTGHPFSDHVGFRYLATVQDGGFVWHVFVQR